jgi:hypothetical protein
MLKAVHHFPDCIPRLLALLAMKEMPQLGYLSLLTAVIDVFKGGKPLAEELLEPLELLLTLSQAQDIPSTQLHGLLQSFANMPKKCLEDMLW